MNSIFGKIVAFYIILITSSTVFAKSYYRNISVNSVKACQGQPDRIIKTDNKVFLTYFNKLANCQVSFIIRNGKVHKALITNLNGMPIKPQDCQFIQDACLLHTSHYQYEERS